MNGTEFVILIILIVGYLLNKGYKNDPLNFFSKLTGWILSIVGFILPFLITSAFIDTGSKLLNGLCIMGVFIIEIAVFCLIIGSETVQKGFKDRREQAINTWHENFLIIGKDITREEIELFLRRSPVLTMTDGKIDIQKAFDDICKDRSHNLKMLLYNDKNRFNELLGCDLNSLPPIPYDRCTCRVNGEDPGRGQGGANYNTEEFAIDYIMSKTGLQYLANYYGSTSTKYYINRQSDYYKRCVAYIKGKCGGKQSERVAYEKYIQCINEFEDERTRVLAESEKRLRERRRWF